MTHSDAIVDFYSLISEFFQRHLEAASLAVDELVDATGASVDQAAEAILNEHKLFSIGLGADCAGATALASLLHRGVLRERPSLPVVELAEHHIESVEAGVNWVSQKIQALGQPGDVGFVFAALLGEPEIQRLASAAEQRQMTLVWVGNRGPGLSISLTSEGIETRLTLNTILAICLARLIDTHTFGPMES
ncbi:MAG: hypothetical protein EVA63_01290 [Halieaceae bacterium]|nr:MAG: hypothetical protein EVA63_01290 [Halieaceae bacterium]